MTDPSFPLDPRAKAVLRHYRAQLDAGEPAKFEAIGQANPALDRQLRELKHAIDITTRLRTPTGDRPLAERLKQKFGADPGPTASLVGEPRPDSCSSSTLFDGLRGAITRGTRYKLLGDVARGGCADPGGDAG